MWIQQSPEGAKNRKTPGVDSMPAKLLKILDDKGKMELLKIFNEVYVNGKWPQEFMESIVVPLEIRWGLKNVLTSELSTQ